MQSMKRDGLLGMSVRYCQPTASQDGENLVLTFAPCRWNLYDADGLSVIFPCDTFLYLMYFFFFAPEVKSVCTDSHWRVLKGKALQITGTSLFNYLTRGCRRK